MNNQYRKFISVALICLLVVISVQLWNSRSKEAPLLPDGVYTQTERGFKSDIELTVTVSGGKIVDIQAVHDDTPGISDAAFNQVIPSIIAAQSADVDTASGATVSSKAIINGVKKIIENNQPSTDEQLLTVEELVNEEVPVAEQEIITDSDTQPAPSTKALSLPDGVYTATEQGFKDSVELTVTVSDGKIVSIEVVHNDTPGIADLAIDQVIPSIIAAQSVDVDTASHATVTSKAIINGVKKIIDNQPAPATKALSLQDGVYTAKEQGFKDSVELTVTVSDGKIESIEVVHNDTPGIADLAVDQVIPSIIAAQSVDVDTATHATVTSNAIINAVKKIIEENQ